MLDPYIGTLEFGKQDLTSGCVLIKLSRIDPEYSLEIYDSIGASPKVTYLTNYFIITTSTRVIYFSILYVRNDHIIN
jgi:hypothetical protein